MKPSGIKFIKHLTKTLDPRSQNFQSLKDTKHLELFILTLNDEFEKEVENIRNAFDIDLSEINENTNKSAMKMISFMENSELGEKVNLLRKKLKLEKDWFDPLMKYVVTDDTLLSHCIEGLKIEINEKRECKLILTKETTLKEIIKAWPVIERELQKNNTRNKPWKKFWRDHDIYKMAINGKSVAEIWILIKKKYGEDLDYGNIIKIESTFRKKVGNPKTPRKNKLRIK